MRSQGNKLEFDEDKIDDFTLALLYLVAHEREEGCGARAWKGFDWETLNRLHDKGYISNPVGKAKSVTMTEEGFLKAKALFEQHFTNKTNIFSLPKFTVPAKKEWNTVPEKIRKEILDNVWCARCKTDSAMQLLEGVMERRCLVLRGTCKRCGGAVSRVIEPEDE
jgi:hypothetical protein